MVAVAVGAVVPERPGGVERAADQLAAPNPAGQWCGFCGGTGWVPEWNRSCPSDRHRSELELTWWAFEDGLEHMKAARQRPRRPGAAG
jgi:hypothetical protein